MFDAFNFEFNSSFILFRFLDFILFENESRRESNETEFMMKEKSISAIRGLLQGLFKM